MESYAQALNYGIPFFIVLITIEWVISYVKGKRINRSMDVISSLSSGMTNSVKDVLGLAIVIVSYGWMVDNLAFFEMKEAAWWVYLLAFIGLDFAGYWSHRWSHEINLFWNRHIIHHSSEDFNLSCALRQSISSIIGIFFFLYLPMALIGIPAKVVAILAPIHLFAQFWYHTQLIGTMGFLEHILVTPSHHRVHHAINKEYIDKNFAQIFIVWDKWFGTFQEELPDVPAVYGVKRPVGTWNPVLINFIHLWGLIKDAWRTQNWWDKLRIWFMPTGWRPKDVKEKYPVYTIQDVSQQQKYEPYASQRLKTWSWVQLISHIALMLYLFNHIAAYTLTQSILYGLFLTVSIFAYTTLMDRHPLAVLAEVLKVGLGFGLMYLMGGWYLIDNYLPGGSLMIGAYLLISLAMSVYFTYGERKAAQVPVNV